MKLTDNEIQDVVRLLDKLEPGFLPKPVFKSVARLVVTPTIQLIPTRKVNGKLEVLLIARTKRDTGIPGTLNNPGTVILATDEYGNFDDAFIRLAEEINHTELKEEPHFVGTVFQHNGRGGNLVLVYTAVVDGEPKAGKFYPVDNLPENIFIGEPEIIELVARSKLVQ